MLFRICEGGGTFLVYTDVEHRVIGVYFLNRVKQRFSFSFRDVSNLFIFLVFRLEIETSYF